MNVLSLIEVYINIYIEKKKLYFLMLLMKLINEVYFVNGWMFKMLVNIYYILFKSKWGIYSWWGFVFL